MVDKSIEVLPRSNRTTITSLRKKANVLCREPEVVPTNSPDDLYLSRHETATRNLNKEHASTAATISLKPVLRRLAADLNAAVWVNGDK